MGSINLFIKDNIKRIGNDAYVSPDIPEKKLNNAIKSFKCENFYESIVAIYDNTIFGSSKEGLVFTGEKMIYNNGTPIVFNYLDIESVEHIRNVSINDKGKEKIEEYTLIQNSDGQQIKLTGLITGKFNYEEFSNFLNEIINDHDKFQEEDQLKTISEMPNDLKIAYIKVIANMTLADDNQIDEKELAELFLLMTRIELDKESRFKIREYITEISQNKVEELNSLVDTIRAHAEPSHFLSLMISLVKDMINVNFSTKEKEKVSKDFAFLQNNKSLFEISDAQIDVAYETVKNDYEMLKGDMDDDTIKKNAKELAAKAAAAGAPLAAVYISGSVIGMSAAGITSGLATLGMGMGMTGGLAIIGIVGVISYKGVKQLTGANELDKYKSRELMLNDVIKQTHKTISVIIDDINFVVGKLNDTILKHSEHSDKVKKLTLMVAQFQGALKSVDTKSNNYQNSANRLQCPKFLDEQRLQSLTEDPTKKPLYQFIVQRYEEELIEVDGKQHQKFVLKSDIDTEILDKMGQIFKALGYFNMDSILKSKAKGALMGAFG